ncbi:peptidyl-prolyl cis-trans isomerase [Rhodosalinus sp. 5P4]|uniref:peptidylprolyl isomerase n=1 Tax=Rhodosalinus sp. 5P4 TaxID=3239196 RepID=UPI0035248D86
MSARASISKTLVWILLGLLIIGLAGFGATNLSGTIRTVGTVGDKPISVDAYARALQDELRAISAETGRAVSFQEARAAGLDQQVLARLITTAALDHETARLGISVGDATLAGQLREIPAFQGPDGTFDREAYRVRLDNVGLTEAEFEEDLREETARTLVQGAVLAGTPAPDALSDRLLGYLGERRDFTWATLAPEDLETPLPEPTESDLRAYYEANIDAFTAPETRAITYAWLTPEMILDTVQVDEAALRELYEERSEQFNQPERRLVERLVFADETAAAEAMARLEAGETDFDALVEERGLTLSDVDLGDVSRDELDAAAGAVFDAGTGDVVGPAPSPLGPALYRVNAILNAQETSFEEARELLREELAMSRARRVVENQAEGMDDLLAGGATLEDLAAETEMRLGQIDWHPGVEDGIAAYEDFRTAAARVGEDDYPAVETLGDGGIFALRLDDTLPPAPRPFDEVEEQVRAGWEGARALEALAAEAEEIASALREGRRFAAMGLRDATVTEGATRSGFVPDAPERLLETVFEMDTGEVRVIEGDGRVVIARLDAATPPDRDDPATAELAEAIERQVSGGIAQDLFEAYLREIRARAGVQLDQAAINAVHAQFQ